MTKTNKPQYKTELIKKDDGTSVSVCRCHLKDLDTLLEIQDRLIKKYIDEDGAIGKLITDEEVRADLTTACSLLPLSEKTKTGEIQYLNFEDIEDNWEQLVTLFFNGGLNMDTRVLEDILPSRISQLHFFPYMETFRTHHEQVTQQREKEKK